MSLEAQRVFLTKKMEQRVGEFAFPVAMPNQTFNIPKNAPYGEFAIMSGGKPIIVGGEGPGKVRNRYIGMVQIVVFVPKEKGTKAAMVAGDVFKSIFQLKTGRDTAQAAYRFGVMEDFTPETKAGWECFVYRVPFKRDIVEQVEIGA